MKRQIITTIIALAALFASQAVHGQTITLVGQVQDVFLNTTLSADGNMYSRRGYGSAELNTDDFVLNASISQPFFKGKLIARIEAFDLLHQLSNTQYTVNAQGRTETWYRSLPHYVMAHLVYHWNKNPKKK